MKNTIKAVGELLWLSFQPCIMCWGFALFIMGPLGALSMLSYYSTKNQLLEVPDSKYLNIQEVRDKEVEKPKVGETYYILSYVPVIRAALAEDESGKRILLDTRDLNTTKGDIVSINEEPNLEVTGFWSDQHIKSDSKEAETKGADSLRLGKVYTVKEAKWLTRIERWKQEEEFYYLTLILTDNDNMQYQITLGPTDYFGDYKGIKYFPNTLDSVQIYDACVVPGDKVRYCEFDAFKIVEPWQADYEIVDSKMHEEPDNWITSVNWELLPNSLKGQIVAQ